METPGPLTGVSVVDLTTHVAGPFATKLLAAYGADVVKVERPGAGDPARRMAPFVDDQPGPDRSLVFQDLNVGKRGVAIDLTTVAGRDLLLALVAGADVVVESFRPGVLERLGLSPATLDAARPGIVITSVSSFGQTGPYRDLTGSDLVLYAMGHAMHGTGLPDREPLAMAPHAALRFAGLTAALATVTALLGRTRHGHGDRADVAVMETYLASIDRRADSLVSYAYCGETLTRPAPADRGFPPLYNPCEDGWFTVAVTTPTLWRRLVEVLGDARFSGPQYQPPMRDPAARSEFSVVWREWCATRSKQTVVEELQAAGLAAAPVNTMADVVVDPHLAARGFFEVVDHPATGAVPHVGGPFRMAGASDRPLRPAPSLGQHDDEVLGPLRIGAT